MTDQLCTTDAPLVLHVIPTARARGAQREARALADRLDTPATRVHRVLSLFAGPAEVEVDASLDFAGHNDTPSLGFDPRLALSLRAALARMDPDVVVAHGSEPLKYLVPAMAVRRRPLVYYAIGTYSGSPRPLQLRLWRFLMRRADVVAAEGQEVLDECVGRMAVPPGRVVLAPNGRDPEQFRPAPPVGSAGPGSPGQVASGPPTGSEAPLVAFVGALTEGKGPDRFIGMVGALRSLGVALRAMVVGDGPLGPGLAAPAAAAGVVLLGGRSDVAELLSGADLLVFPSRPAGEGMPGVLIEAGLSGLPVVATDVPGVRSIVVDGTTGVVVPPDDPDALASATARLLGDAALRSSMGRAARSHCEDHFGLAAVGDRWLSILQPLLEGSVRGPRP
jgi:glycosyltransferase involved in cell wall biosynthesis